MFFKKNTTPILIGILLQLSSFSSVKAEVDLTSNIKADGLLDSYYSYDFNSPGTRKRDYFTQGSVNKEGNINLAYFGISAKSEDFYGRIALQYGTSVDANYSGETYDNTKYVQEAYLGKQINEKLKIDVGIFFSHIGLESFISRDNSTYTRSLVSEFSPYYQSGARLEYTASDFYKFQLLFINGWQNISTDQVHPTLGTQIVIGKNDQIQLSYNTFFGQREGGFRTLQDFILKVPIGENLETSAVVDWGYESAEAAGSGSWHGLLLIVDYRLIESLNLVGRIEQYADPNSIIVTTENGEAFRANSGSVGLNYSPFKNLAFRTEYKIFSGSNSIFRSSPNTFDKNESLLINSVSLFF